MPLINSEHKLHNKETKKSVSHANRSPVAYLGISNHKHYTM